MRATDFIRSLLDVIDNIETKNSSPDYEDEVTDTDEVVVDPAAGYSNSPDETYASTDVVLSVGNDINKPKHPSDLRADSISLYPNMQYDPRKM